jgi:hypothetical protein
MIMAIDPGPEESGYIVVDFGILLKPKNNCPYIVDFKICENSEIEKTIEKYSEWNMDLTVLVEKIKSYGMSVGESTFQTVFMSGRFSKIAENCMVKFERIPRHAVKMHLCGNTRAKDKNIITAIVDRYDPMRRFGLYGKGTKKNPGPFYGFSKHIWQAFALAITWSDKK